MVPLTSVFVYPLGGDVPYNVSVRINLENEAKSIGAMKVARISAISPLYSHTSPRTAN